MRPDETEKKLIKLLDANREVANWDVCIAEIQNGNLVQRNSEWPVAPLEHILRVYSVRASLAKKYKWAVYGLDEVVKDLGKAAEGDVMIDGIQADRVYYQIFTDAKREVLYGIVAIDQTGGYHWDPGNITVINASDAVDDPT